LIGHPEAPSRPTAGRVSAGGPPSRPCIWTSKHPPWRYEYETNSRRDATRGQRHLSDERDRSHGGSE